jgi:uncharacterized integral membrane protein
MKQRFIIIIIIIIILIMIIMLFRNSKSVGLFSLTVTVRQSIQQFPAFILPAG